MGYIFTFFLKQILNLNFHVHIWIQHEKVHQMITNKPTNTISSVFFLGNLKDVEKVLSNFIFFCTKTPVWKGTDRTLTLGALCFKFL